MRNLKTVIHCRENYKYKLIAIRERALEMNFLLRSDTVLSTSTCIASFNL